jgi:putative ABC transport system permease protein
VLVLLTVAVAATVFSVSAAYTLVPSADARFGTANHRLELERADRRQLDAEVAAIEAWFGTVDVINRRAVPVAGSGVLLGATGAYLALLAGYHDDLEALGRVPVAHLAVIVIGLPLSAAAAVGWLLAGREPSTLARQPLEEGVAVPRRRGGWRHDG